MRTGSRLPDTGAARAVRAEQARASAGSMVRVALVGCGAVSRLYHAPALAALERAGEIEVRQLVDPDQRAAAELRRLLPGAAVSTDTSAVTGEEVDLVLVASPPRFHARQAIEALRAGVHVLCEKPLAASVQEGVAMMAAADAVGRMLAAGMIRRFLPAAQLIRAILSQQLLGPVRSFSCREVGEFRWPTQSAAFFDRSGGGLLMDVGVHVLDLLGWWLGEVADVHYEDDAMGGAEANCRIQLCYAGGVEGEVRLSREPGPPSRYRFQCEHGWLSWIPGEPEHVQIGIEGASQGLDASVREHAAGERGARSFRFEDAFLVQLRNVIAAARGEDALAVSGRDALESLALIERCYRERHLLPMPWLGDDEQSYARLLHAAR